MKRTIIALVCVLCISGAVFATGAQSEVTPAQEITFFFGGSNRTQILQEVVNLFNEQSDDTVVDLTVTSQDYQTVLQARVASGNPPDIASHLVGQVLKQYVDAGHIRDISGESFLDFVIPGGTDPFTIDGGTYAIPLDSQVWGLYYNKDLFAQAGIDSFPQTIDGLAAAIDALKANGIAPFSLTVQTGWTLGQIVYIGGSPALYDEANANLDALLAGDFDFNRPGTTSIESALGLILANRQANANDTDLSGQYVAFATGATAMMPQGNWSILQLRELNPDLNAGLAALPLTNNPADTRYPVANQNPLAVFNTPNIDGVRSFLNFFLDKSGPAKVYYNTIGIPTGIKGEALNIDPIMGEAVAAIDAGMIVPWMQSLLPPGMSNSINVAVQEYAVSDPSEHQSLADALNEILASHTSSSN